MLHEKSSLDLAQKLYAVLSKKHPSADLNQSEIKVTADAQTHWATTKVETLSLVIQNLQLLGERLRGPQGCPWDKEQTHQSLCRYATEETAELVDAIESKSEAELKEELGDVLFQVILHSQIASERGAFDLADVVNHLLEKMIYRHPHVFKQEASATDQNLPPSTEQVLSEWEKLKNTNPNNAPKKNHPGDLRVPVALPSLQRSEKIGFRTQKLNFDWSNATQVESKVAEEWTELLEAKTKKSILEMEEEFGDLLFTMAQWGRHLNIDPELALRKANRKFESRFKKMMDLVEQRKLDWTQLDDTAKEKLWQEIKK